MAFSKVENESGNAGGNLQPDRVAMQDRYIK
jgi:hypothetical protein